MLASSPGWSWRPAASQASVDHASAVTGTRRTSWADWLATINAVPSRFSPRALNALCPDSTGMRLNRRSLRSEYSPISTASSTKIASAEETSSGLVAAEKIAERFDGAQRAVVRVERQHLGVLGPVTDLSQQGELAVGVFDEVQQCSVDVLLDLLSLMRRR